MPQRCKEVAAIVGDNDARTGRARDLGNVRVVDPAARGPVLDSRVKQSKSIAGRQIVHRHSGKNLIFEQSRAISRC